MTSITGVYTAIVTPIDQNDVVNEKALREQVSRQIAHGNNIFCNGTNGEFFALSDAEKLVVTEICLDEAAGRKSVMTHIGCVSTEATIRLGKQIQNMGVDAVSVITPWFAALRRSDLITHFQKVADALTVPVYLYNIPARTGNTITPDIAEELAAHSNIKGIKDSAGSYDSLHAFHEVSKRTDDFSVLTGPDSLILRGFKEGSAGCISGIANIIPDKVNAVWQGFKNNQEVDSIQDEINNIRTELYGLAFSPAVVKKCVSLMGFDIGENQYPVVFHEDDVSKIKVIMKNFKLI